MNIVKSFGKLMAKRRKAIALLKASIMLQKGIEKAEKKYKTTGHRYYLIYDPNKNELVPITYDIYILRTDSYIYLRRRGKMPHPLTRRELKERCFYYTPSKNVPDRRSTGEEQKQKMLKWQKYYSMFIYGRK